MDKFKLKVTIRDDGSIHTAVVDRGRGGWVHSVCSDFAHSFTGYDGENSITIFFMLMQDGSTDILIVSASVDNPAHTWQTKLAPLARNQRNLPEADGKRITNWVNKILGCRGL